MIKDQGFHTGQKGGVPINHILQKRAKAAAFQCGSCLVFHSDRTYVGQRYQIAQYHED